MTTTVHFDSAADRSARRTEPLRLANGVEFVGLYDRSGCADPPHLLRRADGRMLEVSPLLHMVAVAIDGERGLDEIAAAVRAESGRPVSVGNVAYLIEERLAPLGVIAGRETPTLAATSAPTPLSLSVRTGVIPKRAVRALASALRPLFLPPLVVGALLGLVLVDAYLLWRHPLGPALHQLAQQPALVLLVVALTVLAGGLHELGHATASRYGGAEPGTIGIGIYLVWPVFYNDLNDSYRLSRRGRLRADLGGVYFNVLFILLLAGAYALTGLQALLLALAAQHLAILQQFLPFVRLDGYYVVSDLAGVPDLFGRIRPILLSLVPGRRPHPLVAELKPLTRAIVTLWVVVTVPLLTALVTVLLLRLPHLVVVVWKSATLTVRSLGEALRTGTPLSGVISGLSLGLVVIPVIGLAAAFRALVRRCFLSVSQHHRTRLGSGSTSGVANTSDQWPRSPLPEGSETRDFWSAKTDVDGQAPAPPTAPAYAQLSRADRWLGGEQADGRLDDLDPIDVWSGFTTW